MTCSTNTWLIDQLTKNENKFSSVSRTCSYGVPDYIVVLVWIQLMLKLGKFLCDEMKGHFAH